jgi:hypothetical protein
LIELGNKLALLVGINNYMDPSIIQLNYSVKDIEDIYEILVDSKRGAYTKNNIAILTDKTADKPIRSNILSKLKTMSTHASGEDSVLFYFSGHGLELNGQPYLLCSDSQRNTLEDTALSTQLVRKIMETSLARIKIIILDACHSGVIKGIKDSGIMTKSFFESFFPPSEGFVVMTSCKLGEFSHEWAEKENGVFSYYLLDGLRGNADTDNDGAITVTDAHRYCSENVKRWAFATGVEQNPTLEAKISGDILFVSVEKPSIIKTAIDKSVIKEITLVTDWSEESSQKLAEDMCGSLLQFVDAETIKKNGNNYEFPHGLLHYRNSLISKQWKSRIEASFKYTKENWEMIDKIVGYFDLTYYWSSLIYKLTKNINVGSLVRKCKERGFEILSFKPEKGSESLTVKTQPWLNTETIFENEEQGSRVCISKRDEGYLPNDFYSTLSPENMSSSKTA